MPAAATDPAGPDRAMPNARPRALLLEAVHQDAEVALDAAGFDVERLDRSLDTGALLERIPGVSLLGIRSKTQVSAPVLDAAGDLLAIGVLHRH